MSNQGWVEQCATLETEGNVVDVAIVAGELSLIYSMDNLHASNSTTITQTASGRPALGSYTYLRSSGSWIRDSVMGPTVIAINDWASMRQCHLLDLHNQLSTARDLLYSTERLRKREQDDDSNYANFLKYWISSCVPGLETVRFSYNFYNIPSEISTVDTLAVVMAQHLLMLSRAEPG